MLDSIWSTSIRRKIDVSFNQNTCCTVRLRIQLRLINFTIITRTFGNMDSVPDMLKTISLLPKEIRDCIYSYNIEHRLQMNQVCIEIQAAATAKLWPFTVDAFICDGCGRESDDSHEDMSLYSKSSILGTHYVFCCGWCSMSTEHEILSDTKHRKRNCNYNYRVGQAILKQNIFM